LNDQIEQLRPMLEKTPIRLDSWMTRNPPAWSPNLKRSFIRFWQMSAHRRDRSDRNGSPRAV